jgi:hypothetical protein
MIQKYFAYHSAFILLVVVLTEISGFEPPSYSGDGFDNPVLNFLLFISILWLIVPIIANYFSMALNALKSGRLILGVLSIFLGPWITVPYYFIVYRKNENI